MDSITDLATPDNEKFSIEQFNQVTKSGDYLPRLQVFGANSEAVKKKKIPMGHLGLVKSKDEIIDMGESVDVLNIAWRPKAMRITDDAVFQYFHSDNPEFQKVQEEAGERDSGCMFGPEFLIYIPGPATFATFYMGSKSARREGSKMFGQLKKPTTIVSKYIEWGKFAWYGPNVLQCTTPLSKIPDQTDLTKEFEKFQNAEDSAAEKDDAVTTDERAR